MSSEGNVSDDYGRSVESHHDSTTHVSTITFTNGRNNYFDYELLEELTTQVEAADEYGARAIVLRSGAKHFCAGMKFQPHNLVHGGGAHIYDDIVPRLFEQSLPIIAEIDGAAVGGGFGLALMADFRVASPRARFAANFARIGVSNGFATTATLPRLVNHQIAAELLYTGRRVSGSEAREIGLCDALAESEQVSTVAHDMAYDIASSGPLAVKSIRESLRYELLQDLPAVLQLERTEQDRLRRSNDFAEGVAAYSERRAPTFTAS